MTAELVTIPASNFVEKARWALQLAGVEFTESKYAPLLVYSSTVPKGGRSVPVLALPATGSSSAKVLTDSSDILDLCATKMPALYPTSNTKSLEREYDDELGPYTRLCHYHIVYQDPDWWRVFADPVGFVQYYLTWLLYPVMRSKNSEALGLTPEAVEQAWAKVEKVVAEAEERLGDGPVGSRFLDGDAFSAADITFCAHMTLILFPVQHVYLAPHFSVAAVRDPVFKARLEKLQASKIGQFVVWCYEHRRPPMQADMWEAK